MREDTSPLHDKDIAEAVRSACMEAARTAYKNARLQGLCAEGAWESAMGAIESLDVNAIIGREEK